MKHWFRFITIKGLTLIGIATFGQTQNVKGKIMDAQADYPLIGASILLLDSDPVVGAVTDIEGEFKLTDIPVGRQTFAIQYVGYKSITMPNVLVTAGKEVVLNIKLEESVEKLNEVVVTANADKDAPLNELAKVSARTFSLEEVTRFSGGRNDVARLATSFAGVSAPNDSRNDIVVRGNSPVGLLWRIEGIPVATTNHFATLGTTGGPVNALNTNLLRTSDFLTGAFPAEYGNANGAVFDVNFRNGNADKYEFTGQLSAFSGLEFMAEGPLSQAKGASFVASYRYGIASVAATGTGAIPYYQDFSFKLNLGETRWGRFELFGIGGLSSIDFLGDEIDEDDLFANPNEDAFVDNQLGLIGLNHTLRLNKTTFLKTSLGASTNYNQYLQDNFINDNDGNLIGKFRSVNAENRENRFTFSSTLNKKFNARWSLRAGVLTERYQTDFSTEDRDNRVTIPDENNDGVPDFFITQRDLQDGYFLTQAFAQTEYKITDDLNITAGLHAQHHEYTEDFVAEPRAAVSWQARPNQRLSLAYGLHAQAIPSPILFFEEEIATGQFVRTNERLDFMKSHHFVLAYDRNLGMDWRLKAETYYQSIFDVPVERIPSSYSILNEGSGFIFDEKGSLINEGTGHNYGIELTLEKFFSQGYYMLMTTSLYESRYEGSDGIERNTAFNNNIVYNLLLGKEWKFGVGGRNAWTFDSKFTTAGGATFTPVDLEATRANAGRELRMDEIAFSQRYDAYFRWDVKFGVRLNSKNKNVSHQFFVDLQNVTNRENEFLRRYNEVTDEVNQVDQIGFFPDILYRIQF
ncbi:TonB-dependent receptor [Fulvivirga sp. M361]|uniref:TonB-dependent receptor n=1 Tax=Fulvivirga sp. M361 TaxID=2594266 RepID=UPI00117BBF95|nr:TonB-dependent receptor [Fulvivirga sp. M361]TRX61428.1 TonB-dependent receptor [Fulvivirga sp. M361]